MQYLTISRHAHGMGVTTSVLTDREEGWKAIEEHSFSPTGGHQQSKTYGQDFGQGFVPHQAAAYVQLMSGS